MISVAMSRLDGARAAAVMFSDGRLSIDFADESRALGAAWGDPEFSIGDAAQCAFLGSGCEGFSRHHQLMQSNWDGDHIAAFWHGFLSVARECLWPGGFKE